MFFRWWEEVFQNILRIFYVFNRPPQWNDFKSHAISPTLLPNTGPDTPNEPSRPAADTVQSTCLIGLLPRNALIPEHSTTVQYMNLSLASLSLILCLNRSSDFPLHVLIFNWSLKVDSSKSVLNRGSVSNPVFSVSILLTCRFSRSSIRGRNRFQLMCNFSRSNNHTHNSVQSRAIIRILTFRNIKQTQQLNRNSRSSREWKLTEGEDTDGRTTQATRQLESLRQRLRVAKKREIWISEEREVRNCNYVCSQVRNVGVPYIQKLADFLFFFSFFFSILFTYYY